MPPRRAPCSFDEVLCLVKSTKGLALTESKLIWAAAPQDTRIIDSTIYYNPRNIHNSILNFNGTYVILKLMYYAKAKVIKFEKTIHQQIQQKGRRKPSRLRAAEKNCES